MEWAMDRECVFFWKKIVFWQISQIPLPRIPLAAFFIKREWAMKIKSALFFGKRLCL
jgi:hypothetical protein